MYVENHDAPSTSVKAKTTRRRPKRLLAAKPSTRRPSVDEKWLWDDAPIGNYLVDDVAREFSRWRAPLARAKLDL